MDVLIKGYDMPKCCNDCAFHKEGRIVKSVKSSDIIYKIIVRCEICGAEDSYMSYTDADTKKRDDCPLIAVPPHDIKAVPSADVEPVRHGHWEGKTYKCSLCSKWIAPLQGDADMNYCPNCGAKMDGEE